MKLNNEQLIAYQDILNSVINKEGKLYFLYAPVGTGKTFLINLLLTKLMTKIFHILLLHHQESQQHYLSMVQRLILYYLKFR